MDKNLIFVLRGLENKDRKLFHKDNSRIIALNTEAILSLGQLKMPYAILRDYRDKNEYEKNIEELMRLVDGIGDYSADCKRSLKEILSYNDIGLWEFYKHHFTLELIENFLFYKIIKKIIEYEKPEQITIIGIKGSDLINIIKSTAKSYNIGPVKLSYSFPSKLKHVFNFIFNYFLISPYPIINLLKRFPNSFIHLEKLQWIKERFSHKDKELLSRSRIVALSFTAYHLFIEIIANIKSQMGGKEPIKLIRADILTKDFKRRCNKHMMRYEPFYNYVTSDIKHKLKETLTVFLDRKKTIRLDSLHNYVKDRIGFSCKKTLTDFFNTYLLKYGLKRFLRFKLIVESIIEKEKPALILIREDRTAYGEIASFLIKQKGIKSLVILPAAPLFEYDIFWSVFLRRSKKSDKMAVVSNATRDLINRYGTPNENITVIGNPVYDKLIKQSAAGFINKDAVYSKLNIDKKKGIFIFASQLLPDSDKVHKVLITMMQHFPDKHLIIKLHPEELPMRSSFAAKKSKLKNVTVIKNFDILSLINASEIFITISSSSAVAAMALKKPVIILGISPSSNTNAYLEANESFYVERGAALGAYNERDLILNINKALKDKDAREALFKNAETFLNDNITSQGAMPSSKKLSDLIIEIVSEQSQVNISVK